MRALTAVDVLALERLRRGDRLEATLRELEHVGDLRAARSIFAALIHHDARVGSIAANALASIIARTRAHDFVDLDLQLRGGDDPASFSWGAVSSMALDRLEQLPHAPLLLGLAASSANGRVREEALWRLGARPEESSFAFVLLRLNDWVPEVRSAARAALTPFLASSYAASIVRHLPLIERLRRGGRVETGLLDRIEAVLAAPDAHGAFEAATHSDDPLARRCALSVWLRLSPNVALATALADHDAHTRLWAVRELVRRPMHPDRTRDLERLFRDHFMPVRRLALEALLAISAEPVPTQLREALIDSHVSMREVARFEILRRSGRQDFAGVYRTLLAQHSTRALLVGVSGLGETGTAGDAQELVPFLKHAIAAIRRAALIASDRLDTMATTPRLYDALRDDSSAVANTAARALGRVGRAADASRLRALLQTELPAANRCIVVALACSLSRWQSLPVLIEACDSADTEVTAIAHKKLSRWLGEYNASFVAPTPAQRVEIADVMGVHAAKIPSAIRRELQLVLHTWR